MLVVDFHLEAKKDLKRREEGLQRKSNLYKIF